MNDTSMLSDKQVESTVYHVIEPVVR